MKCIILLLLILCPYTSIAQTYERFIQEKDSSCLFHPRQLILPASLITVGAIGINKKWFKAKNIWEDSNPYKIDNYIQYLPAVSSLGLSLLGVKAKHNYKERISVLITSHLAMGIMTNSLKYVINEKRPDSDALNSFPSGHTAMVFTGAEIVRSEYSDASIWYGIGSYTIACGVAFLRLYNQRHWLNDVIAGAGIGILSARIGYWLLPLSHKLFKFEKKDMNLIFLPLYQTDSKSFGGSLALSF